MRQQIAEMGGIVSDMVRTAMEAFARRDLALCLSSRPWTTRSTG